MSPGADIWWWVGAAVLALAAVVLGVIGWRGDRPCGRRRCPRCWYDMAGVRGLRCPECGREARSERRLLRTRRKRWALALCTVLLLASGAVLGTQRVRQDGWARYAPSTLLIWMLPTLDDHESPAYRELRSRLAPSEGWFSLKREGGRLDTLWDWQRSLLAGRCTVAIAADAPAAAHDLALMLLWQLGPDAAPAVPRLCELLGEGRRSEREMICEVLASIGPAALPSLPYIREYIREYSSEWETWSMARLALDVVVAIGPEAADAVPDVIHVLEVFPSEWDSMDARVNATRALAAIGPAAAEALPSIIALAENGPHAVRLEAVRAVVAVVPDDEAAHAVVLHCLREPEVTLRDAAAAVARAHPAILAKAIEAARRDLREDAWRHAGLWSCVSLDADAATLIPELAEMARSESPVTRLLAVTALASHVKNRSAADVLRVAATDSDPRVHAVAIAALRKGGSP